MPWGSSPWVRGSSWKRRAATWSSWGAGGARGSSSAPRSLLTRSPLWPDDRWGAGLEAPAASSSRPSGRSAAGDAAVATPLIKLKGGFGRLRYLGAGLQPDIQPIPHSKNGADHARAPVDPTERHHRLP